MKLLYSGAKQPLSTQSDSNQSLGGYVSNSIVSNSLFNNLFPDESYYTSRLGNPIYRCIFLENDSGSILSGRKIGIRYVTQESERCFDLKLSIVVLPSPYEKAELIPNENSKPYFSDFQSCEISDSIDDSALIPDIPVNGRVAIWFEKVYKIPTNKNLELRDQIFNIEIFT